MTNKGWWVSVPVTVSMKLSGGGDRVAEGHESRRENCLFHKFQLSLIAVCKKLQLEMEICNRK